MSKMESGDLFIIRSVSTDGVPGHSLWKYGMTNKFIHVPAKFLCFNESLAVVEAAKKHLEGTE